MSSTIDLGLEESVAAMLSGIKTSSGRAAPDGVLGRQAAVILAGRRAAAQADRASLMRDAACLLAETIDVDRCGVSDACNPTPDNQLSFWLSDRVRADGEQQFGRDFKCSADPKNSLLAFAIEARHPIVVANFAVETRFNDAVLIKQGVASAIVCGLRHGKEVLGAVGVFSTTAREFEADDVLLVAAIANVLEASLARRLAEDSLAAHHRMQAAILDTVSALVLEINSEGRIVDLNRAAQEIIGFTAAELKNRPLASALLAPEEAAQVQLALNRVRPNAPRVEFQSFVLTKQGDRRRIAWSFSAVRQTNRPDTLVGTGIDVTTQQAAVEELTKTRQAAAETQRTLDRLRARTGENDGAKPFEKLPEDRHTDRRQRPRRMFPYMQQIAPLETNRALAKHEFQAVRCRDISAGGFSYLSTTAPQHTRIVVAFGAEPNFTYLAAEVVHTTTQQIDGQTMHIIGCRYTRRLE